MSRLPIIGEYPADWKQISDATWVAAGHRCIRCAHPYRKGEHGKGEWTPCDERCSHLGPIRILISPHHAYPGISTVPTGQLVRNGLYVESAWRIGTVHHLDGNKANCVWWNLLALCQRCHLTVQGSVLPERPYFLEHSDWFKPYVAGFYAKKYLSLDVTRDQAVARQDEFLALERLA